MFKYVSLGSWQQCEKQPVWDFKTTAPNKTSPSWRQLSNESQALVWKIPLQPSFAACFVSVDAENEGSSAQTIVGKTFEGGRSF